MEFWNDVKKSAKKVGKFFEKWGDGISEAFGEAPHIFKVHPGVIIDGLLRATRPKDNNHESPRAPDNKDPKKDQEGRDQAQAEKAERARQAEEKARQEAEAKAKQEAEDVIKTMSEPAQAEKHDMFANAHDDHFHQQEVEINVVGEV